MNNKKKEFPVNSLENKCIYKRDVYCFIKNSKVIVSFVKKQINRRFRKSNRKICKQYIETL